MLYWWSCGTSPVVGLFKDETFAVLVSGEPDLKPGDDRWKNETAEVLRAIGREHPVIVPSEVMLTHYGV